LLYRVSMTYGCTVSTRLRRISLGGPNTGYLDIACHFGDGAVGLCRVLV
jgi:hypothetical protein